MPVRVERLGAAASASKLGVVLWVVLLIVGCSEDSVVVVSCTQDAVCPAATPSCDREVGVCVECTAPEHCPSAMCRPTGVCVREEEALFANQSLDGDCTRAAPCDLSTALSKVDEQHDVIAVSNSPGGQFTVLAAPITVTRSLSLFGIPPRDSSISASGFPVAIDVRPGATFVMSALEFSANIGIHCEGGSVDLVSSAMLDHVRVIESIRCTVRVRDTRVVRTSDRAIVAQDGDVDVARTFFTDNSFNGAIKATTARIVASGFFGNGNPDAEFSAIDIEAGEIASSTITGGSASLTSGYAVRCGTARVRSSIVFQNSNLAPFSAGCNVTYTNSQPALSGVGNFEADPLIDSDSIHIGPASPCVGAGDPELVGLLDYDGEQRDSNPDCGADEVL